MIDTLNEYVSPNRFSILAYVCVIIHFHCEVILTAITTALRLGETEKFSCAVDTKFATHKTYVEKTCISIYDDAYNSPVRFSAFIPLGFVSVVVVSVIYSLAVGNRIDETERYSTGSDKSETNSFGEHLCLYECIPSEDDKFTGVLSSTNIYKEKVKNASLTPDINYGPNTSLDDMFIDVVIQTERAPHKFPKSMKRHEIYYVYMKVSIYSIHLKEIKDLFYPNKDTKGNSPHTILALGRPGIGKTVLTRKIMRDWANRIDAFYHMFGTELSEDEFESAFEEIWKCPQNAIFIFYGLDEIGGNLAKFHDFLDQSRMFPNNPTSSMTAMFLFIKILSGHMLPGAKVLVTSRPAANNVYSRLEFERKVEIIGFTSDKIENDPANDNPLPTTLTELYQAALVYFYKHHDRNESKECYQKVIKELQQLAFNGVKNDQLIFDGELVNEQMKESGLLHCLPVSFFQIQTQ
ncbi:Hypothetical predicted protein, partial [Paramuricea clavata]